jgi:hypothetical protein
MVPAIEHQSSSDREREFLSQNSGLMIESTRVPYTSTEYQPELRIEITKVPDISNRAQDTEH